MMDDEEDDFYDPADSVPAGQAASSAYNEAGQQQTDGFEDDEEEVEVEDDDDDFNIITEAPADAPPPEISHPRHTSLRQEPQRAPSADPSIVPKSATPSGTPHLEVATPVPATAGTTAPSTKQSMPLRPGSSYPAVHTSTIDVNGNPVHPSTGKTIMATDMDADFPADDKPWRRPGTDMTDFFNYGFDEFTWVSYCLKQQEVRKEVGDQKKQMEDMTSFLGMGMPPMPGAPPVPVVPGPAAPPMAGMPGMPDMNPEMMQGMLASMMSQGLDPSSMDPMAFMQHAQSMMGGQSGPSQQGQGGFGNQGQGQNYGQGVQGQMGYGGYDQRGNYGGGRGRGRRW
ncbi:Pre-mRNA polyadenylation factor fip1 [Penicillium diatomitis]|uniref:Pre-mRNA polyadenylation factor fip1 n=1 Tax=Penicillium diatomitis TaxID=2819901 RepID=A0A9W9XBR2_9EURO|nr:Pre-mRNA polyadenylation factor fip1 [Penicillium diatomitis]KAJ5488469.1 Pre-mRNA polyadenylation factor fip1 [Penicillium diatomitis]